jgi:hypothetical protein
MVKVEIFVVLAISSWGSSDHEGTVRLTVMLYKLVPQGFMCFVTGLNFLEWRTIEGGDSVS